MVEERGERERKERERERQCHFKRAIHSARKVKRYCGLGHNVCGSRGEENKKRKDRERRKKKRKEEKEEKGEKGDKGVYLDVGASSNLGNAAAHQPRANHSHVRDALQ